WHRPCVLAPEPPTRDIHTLSLHDALPILLDHILTATDYRPYLQKRSGERAETTLENVEELVTAIDEYESRHPEPTLSSFLENVRSEEHTSELQSRENLVCRLLSGKKKIKQ